MTDRPSPRRTSVTAPLLDGCNREELVLQKCQAPRCGKYVYYPRVCCPHCGGGDLDWRPVSGRGEVVSYGRIHRPQHESFMTEAPYYFIAVRLAEGPLLFSRLHPEASVAEKSLIGLPVRAVFLQHTAEQRLVFFAPA